MDTRFVLAFAGLFVSAILVLAYLPLLGKVGLLGDRYDPKAEEVSTPQTALAREQAAEAE